MDKTKGEDQSVQTLSGDYKVPDVWEVPKNAGGAFGSINRPTAGARSEQELPRGRHDLQLYSLGTANGKKVNLKSILILLPCS